MLTDLQKRIMRCVAASPGLNTHALATRYPELDHTAEHLQPALKRLLEKGELSVETDYHASGGVARRRWFVRPTSRKK